MSNSSKKEEKKENHENPEVVVGEEQQEKSAAEAKEDKELFDLKKSLEEVTEEKDKMYQNYLRVSAEQENLKKRHAKEKQDLLKYSNESLFKEFLSVLDSIEKATKEMATKKDAEEQVSALQTGFDLLAKQIQGILKKNGLTPISSDDLAYDPNFHQAVQTEASDKVKVATIKEEFIKGYELHGRLLRPSMVSVFLPENSEKKPKD